ncbi:MAG TPA: HAD-IA family hydrolase [Acidimicrobiales bacterium]|jgi:putative hydrolase of the HAD superfamily|nr:HAD-IA family hydrolase [Acidimicrobiales bacterium]
MPPVDALIVDLDGVIRHWDADHFAETVASFGLDVPAFSAIAFEPELLAGGMTGALSFDEWADEIGRRVAARHGCDAATVTRGFAALRWSVDEGVVALLREVRRARRVKLALFSNASTKLEADLESRNLHLEFDVVFNSARLGQAKPDPDAFRTVAGLLGVPVERCLFVDDTVPNVDGARAAGMQAEAFTGVRSFRSLLERAELLGAPSA